MKKAIMKLACSLNGWLYKRHGVLSAAQSLHYKEVHLKGDAFFEMFEDYERIENYAIGEYDKVYVNDNGVEFFALVEREEA